MLHLCPITRLRDNLGKYVHAAERHGDRTIILKNGREAAGLVPITDLNLLDNAATRTLEFKALQIAEEMLRWRIIREGMEEVRRR